MGEHRHPKRSRFDVAGAGLDVARGAGIGLVIGLLFMGVGFLRAVLLLLTGGKLAALSLDDLRFAVFYLGGFGLAGAVVGGLLPRFRGAVATYVCFAFGGMVVMAAIMAGDKGDLASNDRSDWLALMTLGAVFGLAAGHGWRKRR